MSQFMNCMNMIKNLHSPIIGWGRKRQEYYIHPLLQPFHREASLLVLHTAQMGFFQNERAASLPLEPLPRLNLSTPQGLKQRGRSTAGGLCRQGMLWDTRGACLPAGAAGGAVRWQQRGLRQAIACV